MGLGHASRTIRGHSAHRGTFRSFCGKYLFNYKILRFKLNLYKPEFDQATPAGSPFLGLQVSTDSGRVSATRLGSMLFALVCTALGPVQAFSSCNRNNSLVLLFLILVFFSRKIMLEQKFG